MTEAEKAADEYAEKLWNTGNPRDWAWSDTRKDFLAGFLAGVAWQRGRDVEAVQACAKRLEDGGSIGTAQGAFIAAGAILRESATETQKPEQTYYEKQWEKDHPNGSVCGKDWCRCMQ